MESNSGLRSRLMWFLSEFNQALSIAIHHQNNKRLTEVIGGFRSFVAKTHPTKTAQAEAVIDALQGLSVAIEQLLS